MNEKPLIGVISATERKWEAVHSALPDYSTTWINQPYYDEKTIAKGVPHDAWRPLYIADLKAEQDFRAFNGGILGGLLSMIKRFGEEYEDIGGRTFIGMYHDTLRFSPASGMVYEQAQTKEQWLEQVMLQRGEEVWVCSAFSLLRINGHVEKRTRYITTRVQAKSFTKDQALEFGHEYGIQNLMRIAGGIPLEYAGGILLDDTKPLEVYMHESQELTGKRIATVDNWASLSPQDLLPYHTGAIRGVLQPVVDELG